ncbi:hypothetical protein VTJ04DRAFT_593 [Mycothermus thermophilus]|uniref:uncharacterized protein n=1 Tax=Humicola insolens TaxID=85995 RepID=UPI0037446CA7
MKTYQLAHTVVPQPLMTQQQISSKPLCSCFPRHSHHKAQAIDSAHRLACSRHHQAAIPSQTAVEGPAHLTVI